MNIKDMRMSSVHRCFIVCFVFSFDNKAMGLDLTLALAETIYCNYLAGKMSLETLIVLKINKAKCYFSVL